MFISEYMPEDGSVRLIQIKQEEHKHRCEKLWRPKRQIVGYGYTQDL